MTIVVDRCWYKLIWPLLLQNRSVLLDLPGLTDIDLGIGSSPRQGLGIHIERLRHGGLRPRRLGSGPRPRPRPRWLRPMPRPRPRPRHVQHGPRPGPMHKPRPGLSTVSSTWGLWRFQDPPSWGGMRVDWDFKSRRWTFQWGVTRDF